MNQLLYYSNGSCANHGCEAIVRSLETILSPSTKSINFTIDKSEDIRYGLGDLVNLTDVRNFNPKSFGFLKAYAEMKLGNPFAIDLLPYKKALSALKYKKNILALSVGGDNYCYGGTEYYARLNKLFHNSGIKTAMVGCSIEPDVLTEPVVDDLSKHEIIVARESITYNALQSAGLKNVKLLPDPAFKLKTIEPTEYPIEFLPGNTVGINIGPTIIEYGQGGGILERNIHSVIKYILDHTDMNIALIPHVTWSVSDDRSAMHPLLETYRETGRICMMPEMGAERIKGYISKCKFIITGRTHASIASYSSCVPTLVIGYSIKAKGIATDLFGTYENYVLPTQAITNDNDLLYAFNWLVKNEDTVRHHLSNIMPNYCRQLDSLSSYLSEIN